MRRRKLLKLGLSGIGINALAGVSMAQSRNKVENSPLELKEKLVQWMSKNGEIIERTLEPVTSNNGIQYYQMNFKFENDVEKHILIHLNGDGNLVEYPDGSFQTDSASTSEIQGSNVSSDGLNLPELTKENKSSDPSGSKKVVTSGIDVEFIEKYSGYERKTGTCSAGCDPLYGDGSVEHNVFGASVELGDGINAVSQGALAAGIEKAVTVAYSGTIGKKAKIIAWALTTFGVAELSGNALTIANVDEDVNWGLSSDAVTRGGAAYGSWKPGPKALLFNGFFVPGHAGANCYL